MTTIFGLFSTGYEKRVESGELMCYSVDGDRNMNSKQKLARSYLRKGVEKKALQPATLKAITEKRQREVRQLFDAGYDVPEIAERLNVSEDKVREALVATYGDQWMVS